jgi:hypothetical protein
VSTPRKPLRSSTTVDVDDVPTGMIIACGFTDLSSDDKSSFTFRLFASLARLIFDILAAGWVEGVVAEVVPVSPQPLMTAVTELRSKMDDNNLNFITNL